MQTGSHVQNKFEASKRTAFMDALASNLDVRRILTDPSDMNGYLTDWTGKYRGDAVAVLLPASTAEVAAIVKTCAEHGVAITPQGGNTGLSGGGVPLDGGPSVVLSLARMQVIREVNAAARTATVEAGVVLERLHVAADEAELVFPLTFGAKGSCTIGGNLATNAGGSNVVRYGNARELCLGIEAVLPDGTIVNALSGLRKDNTGYDLRNLLIGSEGTLGVITSAVVKLFRKPRTRATAFVAAANLGAALHLLNRMQDVTGGLVEAFEYMSAEITSLVCEHASNIRQPLATIAETGVLIEIASSRDSDAEPTGDGTTALQALLQAVLMETLEEGLILDAAIASSERQRHDLWRLRESVLEAIMANGPARFLDISLPLDRVAEFVTRMDCEAVGRGFQPLTVGHLGDGNLHYSLSAATGQHWVSLPVDEITAMALDLVAEMSGSFSAEHGIGQSKRQELRDRKNPGALAAMRRIKTAMDPRGLFNPGKVL
jgi:FAD/FMN-containing dehydrogenase